MHGRTCRFRQIHSSVFFRWGIVAVEAAFAFAFFSLTDVIYTVNRFRCHHCCKEAFRTSERLFIFLHIYIFIFIWLYDYILQAYIYIFSTIAQPSLTHTMSLFCHAPRMLSESAYWEIKFQHRTTMNLLRAPVWQRNIFGESIKIGGLTSKHGLWTKQFNGMGILTTDATSKSEILYQFEWLSNLISHRISSVKTLEASSVSNHMSSLVLVRITLWVIIYDIYII